VREYDVVVIGGGPAGVQAAVSARNTYPEKSIALIRKETKPLIPCGIPYVFNRLKSVDENILPDTPLAKHEVEIITGEVVHRKKKCLVLRDGDEVAFDKLVLAAGSVPIDPPIPGRDLANICVLNKDYDELVVLREILSKAARILIVGAGYVGVELAEVLLDWGKSVVIVEKLPQVLPAALDNEFSAAIQQQLRSLGCDIRLGQGVERFVGHGWASHAVLDDESEVMFDVGIVSVGFKPYIELARILGVEFLPKFGVVVDEYLRTSDPDIFAVGDCAAKRGFLTGHYRQIMLASTAMVQGRIAGSNLFSINTVKTFPGILGSFATKVGDTAVGVTGLTEDKARHLGIEYVVGRAEAVDRHPGKLSGASKVMIKLLFARYSHVLLGAQIMGGDSVGELVNMLSVMIQKRMTDMEIDTLQIGTHPLLTPSPLAYPIVNAAVDAIMKWYPEERQNSRDASSNTDTATPVIPDRKELARG